MGAIRLLLVLITPMVACGQALSGFEQHAYAGATVSLPATAFVLSANPAAISGHNLQWFGTRYFGMDALQEGGLSYQRELRNSGIVRGFAIELNQFGFTLYRELQAKSGMAIHVNNARFGVSLGIIHTSIAGYETAYTTGIDTGFQYWFHKRLILGATLQNIPLWSAGNFQPGVYSSGSLGISYKPAKNLILSIASQQVEGYQPDIHTGASYLFEPIPDVANILVVAGYSSFYELWTSGLALHLYRFNATYSFRDHPILGLTHGIGFGVSW